LFSPLKTPDASLLFRRWRPHAAITALEVDCFFHRNPLLPGAKKINNQPATVAVVFREKKQTPRMASVALP